MEKIYPFTILDVAGILDLKVRRRQPTNMDVDCPFCNHKKGKMNINLVKNVFRCTKSSQKLKGFLCVMQCHSCQPHQIRFFHNVASLSPCQLRNLLYMLSFQNSMIFF